MARGAPGPVPSLSAELRPSSRPRPLASSPPRPPFSPCLSSPPLSPPFFSAFFLPSPLLCSSHRPAPCSTLLLFFSPSFPFFSPHRARARGVAVGLDGAAPSVVSVIPAVHTPPAQRTQICADGKREFRSPLRAQKASLPAAETAWQLGVVGQGGGRGKAVLCTLSAFLEVFEVVQGLMPVALVPLLSWNWTTIFRQF